jgi:hypothetical protein
MLRIGRFLAAAALVATPVAAQTPAATPTPPDFPRGKISGYIFADTYYNLDGDPTHHYNASGADSDKVNIDNSFTKLIGKDLNGVQIRRVYFQLDNDLSIKYSTRFRLEVDGKALTSDGKIGVFVKSAYALARSVIPRGDLYIGMASTPTFENPEEFWGYRSIEKTLADFRGIASSSDLGLLLKGWVDGTHRVGYSAMIGTGTGQKPEDNRYKRLYLAIPIRLGDLRVEPYADYENAPAGTDRATYKLFMGYEFRRLAVGVEALDRVAHRRTGGNQEPRGLSMFVRGTATPSLSGFARFDLWQPDHRADDRVDSQLWVAGLDWQPLKDVHFMPNVEGTRFDAKGAAVAPSHDEVQARVTVYYKFSKPQS